MKVINNRDTRIKIANETLDIIKNGFYINSEGVKVSIQSDMDYAISKSILYKPEMFKSILGKIENQKNININKECKIEITGETSIDAASRLINIENIKDILCLNFASAKNPGGGFLNGSQAQEESLARSSGLYPCISQMNEMYEYNRSHKTCLYSDYMIYTPNVPFFRDDSGKLLKQSLKVSIITSPAVNAGVIRDTEKQSINRIDEVMIGRIKKILSIAALNNNKVLILGAFGCGVFKNRPEDVAEYFRKIFIDDGYSVLFNKIVFAIFDNSIEQSKIKIFKKVFDKSIL